MADDGSTQSAATWPLVKFSFQVKWDDAELIFQEVTGLSSETQVIEYRGGSSKVYSTVKMPGIQKFGNVTLKKGMFLGDKALWDKYNIITMNTYKRSTITISLLDEKNEVAMSWTLANAFPVKITVTDMKSDGNEVAVESIELAHEKLTIVK
ncbi:phage tail protein [Flavobacteriaceae bacterium CRH]|jgi:phage tail-like protein|uniref:phage tail protein n=1 Tax=Flavobacterium pectinovorum TaxID=29533 RepID=UPI000740D43F|nr:phage tail protein [Flavobacterium pectinovorum]KUJ59473.1 phage tail protein [Flavobacteriaceae bacterium CRH]WKL50495.1 phage tail protein [Flavobacterium pectinovorum]